MVDLVHSTMIEDRRLSMMEITDACGVSSDFHQILHQDLGMRTLTAHPGFSIVDKGQLASLEECH